MVEKKLINKNKIIDFSSKIIDLMFPNYFNSVDSISDLKRKTYQDFFDYISKSNNKRKAFFSKLEKIHQSILNDLEMVFYSDPSCNSKDEALICFPGVYATINYRIAHELYLLNLKTEARIISEYAHSKTGIDINPGANISDYFFIDHGTGVVIGETCVIGHHVKIFQNVTLGAISLKKGRKLQGKKRHPTIGNYVTIYSGTSILGGDVIIGNNVTIGNNITITYSICDNQVAFSNHSKVILKAKKSI